VLGVGAVAAGCGSSSDTASNGSVGDLKIGVLVPLTGDLSPFGGPNEKAAKLAGDTVNAAATKAGVDLKITEFVQDSKTDPQGAQEGAQKLISSDKVNVLAGPMASSETIPVAENISVTAGVPLISPSATNPDITKLDDNGLVFRTPPSDALQGKVLAQVIGDAIGATKTVNIGARNDPYGNALAGVFEEAWKAGGGKIGAKVIYNPAATSLDSEAGKLAAGNPDAWVSSTSPTAGRRWAPRLPGPASGARPRPGRLTD
jgi:branched-chain amino acid transport system substrate-binding protein